MRIGVLIPLLVLAACSSQIDSEKGGSGGSGDAASGGGHAGVGGGTAAGGGGAAGGAGASTAGPPTTATATGTPGVWERVTPPGIDLTMSWGGMHTILVDPVRPSDVWINCDQQGTYRSIDYGLTWTKTNTGTNGDKVNSGRQWYAAIDPNKARDPNVPPAIFITQGWGVTGLWKSTDGGVNWTDVWSNNIFAPDGVTNISSDVGGDIHSVEIVSKNDPNHLIVSLHGYFGTGNNNGVFESVDGGNKWIVHKSTVFNFQPHSDLLFAVDDTTWLVSHGTTYPDSDLYRTTDAGQTWNVVAHNTFIGRNTCRTNSALYADGAGLFKSVDKGATWVHIDVGVNNVFNCFTGPTKIYITGGNDIYDKNFKIRSAPIDDDTNWTDLPVPNPADLWWGNGMDIGSAVPAFAVATSDGKRVVILTSNFEGGAWRYVEP